MNRNSLLLFVFLFWPMLLCAQVRNTPATRYFGLGSGLYHSASADAIYSPLVYQGKAAFFGLHFGKTRQRYENHTRLLFSMVNREAPTLTGLQISYPANHYQVVRQSFLFESMDYYNYRLSEDGCSCTPHLYLSGLWLTTINITTNAGGVPELIQTAIAPGLVFSYGPGNIRFSSGLHYQLITLAVRNNYSQSRAQTYERLSKFDFVKDNARLQFPGTLLGLYSNTRIAYNPGRRWEFQAGYDFRIIRNQRAVLLQSTSGIYSIGITRYIN